MVSAATTAGQDRHDGRRNAEAEKWAALTARSAALCRHDRGRWQACADRSDELEAAGVAPLEAVRRALEEVGA